MSLPHVTDHALVRYLERAKGFDVESIRQHIAKLCAPYVAAGATSIHAEGVRFELGTGRVITCTPMGTHVSRTRRERLTSKVQP